MFEPVWYWYGVNGTMFGRYQLLAQLGAGGMGQVYRAHDTDTDRVVALKVLPPELAHDELFRERFRREAQVTARLSEPHVIPIHGFGEIEGRLYLDMRLVEGVDLAVLLAGGRAMPAPRAVSLLGQVAGALDAAHAAGLVHRDVKPSNILVTSSDFAYLIDFGIARTGTQSGLTSTGSTIGTFTYMAPERLAQGIVDARADVYALACVLYECLTGSKPFPGEGVERQIAAHLTEASPRPSAVGVPAFDAVIAAGMAKDPATRYPSAGALMAAAEAALRGDTTLVAPHPVPPYPDDTMAVRPGPMPGPAPSRRRGGLVAAGVGAVVLAAAVGVAVVALPSGGSDETSDGAIGTAGASAQVEPSGGSGSGEDGSESEGTASGTAAPTTTRSGTPASGLSGIAATPQRPANTASRMSEYVRAHYADLPGDPAAAWSRLTVRYQSVIGGYAAYREFWDTVASTSVDQVNADTDTDTVTFRLSVSHADGRSGSETRRIQLVQTGESYQIDSAELG